MTPATKALITKDTLAISIILTGLAELPQELGPIADFLPFKLHYIVAVAGVVGIIGSRVLDRLWKVSKSTGFIDLGTEPAAVVTDAGKILPTIPPIPAQQLTVNSKGYVQASTPANRPPGAPINPGKT